MPTSESIDCIVIGYNEPDIGEYERILRTTYGPDSEAYRDLLFSLVKIDGRPMTFVDLLSYVHRAAGGSAPDGLNDAFRSCDIPNLAAAYLTHYLRRRGFSAQYINLFQFEKDLLLACLARNPLCVAITTTFYVWNLPVNEMVSFIREHNPEVKIVVGGPLIANHDRNNPPVTVDPGHNILTLPAAASPGGPPAGIAPPSMTASEEFAAAMSDIGADICIIESQGETTLASLLRALKAGGGIEEIPNLAYRKDGKFHLTPRVPESNSLDENAIDWLSLADHTPGPTLQTRTARSCAFHCAFCAYPTRAGALTLLSLQALERELDSMKLSSARNLVFIDDTFNVPLPRFKDICRLLIRKKYGFEWFSYFRCSNSDAEAIDLMAESGCRGVFLGIESGSPSVLSNMKKSASPDAYYRGIEMLRRHGILTFGSFIIGFPGETQATVSETTTFLRTAGLDYYRAQLWYCEPGTPVYYEKDRFGITGSGFRWSHATMDSLEAMDHIDRIFLSIDSPVWLPQWSFDFWIIPYLTGRGITLTQFRDFMVRAYKLLTLEVAALEPSQKSAAQQRHLRDLIASVQSWSHIAEVAVRGVA
jgi:radical SAM PhpK family P-methyltransferase